MTLGEQCSPSIMGRRREQTLRTCSRSLFGVANPSRLLPLLAAGVLSACGPSSGHRASPFALYGRQDMRAGLPFHMLDDAARKESVRQYQCVSLWVKARRCSLPIETGMLVAILDSTDHVIRLLSASDSLSRNKSDVHGLLIFRDVVRDTRAAWDSVGTLHRDGMTSEEPQLRWSDPSGRWGASLWYSRAHRADVQTSAAAMDTELAMSLPESLTITDLPAYALFMERRPQPVSPTPVKTHPVIQTAAPPSADELLMMLRSDLRAVTISEEGAVHRDGHYETHFDKLLVTPSAGVKLELIRPTADGWSAMAMHPSLPGVSCVVFAGNVPQPPTTAKQGRRGSPGEVVCDQP